MMLTQIIIIISTTSMTCQCHDTTSTSTILEGAHKSQLDPSILETSVTQEEENKDKHKTYEGIGFKGIYNLNRMNKKTFKLDEDWGREEIANGHENSPKGSRGSRNAVAFNHDDSSDEHEPPNARMKRWNDETAVVDKKLQTDATKWNKDGTKRIEDQLTADEDSSKYSSESGNAGAAFDHGHSKSDEHEPPNARVKRWNDETAIVDKKPQTDATNWDKDGAKRTEDQLTADENSSYSGESRNVAAFDHDERESPKHTRVKRWDDETPVYDNCEGKLVLKFINGVFQCTEEDGGPYIIDLDNRFLGGEECPSDKRKFRFRGKIVCALKKGRKG